MKKFKFKIMNSSCWEIRIAKLAKGKKVNKEQWVVMATEIEIKEDGGY